MPDASVAIAQAQDPLILALDVGTSSVRAVIYDALARPVQTWEYHRPYAVTTTSDGGVEIEPGSLMTWFTECIDAATALVTPSGRRIAAVSADTFWHSVMGVDATGEAITPVYMWADTRSSEAAATLQRRLDTLAVHRRTGVVLHSSYWPAKLVWLHHAAPDVVRRVARWISVAEYIYFKLFGEYRVSVSMASGTGIFDQNGCCWDSPMLAEVGIRDEQLSPIADVSDSFSALTREFSQRWPALQGIPWFLPIGDGAANNIGSGGTSGETVVVMIGTSGALRVVREAKQVEIPDGIWTYRVDRRRFVQGGALSAGGNVFAWAVRSFKFENIDELENQVGSLPPDGHRLTVLPFLAGERSPDWNVHAESAILGITLDTSPIEIARALLESTTYRFGLVYNLILHELPGVRTIIGSGAGLLQSPLWMQMMSDVLSQSLTASAVPEATSRGSALLALECLGAIPDISALPAPTAQTYAPNRANTSIYRAAMRRQGELYRKLLT